MSKILVTGGAGFIGSNFIHYWLENHPDDEVVNLDVMTYAGNLANLEDVEDNPNYSFVKGDIRDDKIVNELVGEVDKVIHFAAESHVDRSILGPEVFVETNVKGTFILLEALRRVQDKKQIHFHHISTDEVFGTLELGSDEKFTEQTLYRPNSPYSASKAASDHLVRSYHETYGLPVTITNASNNYGSYQYPEKFIPRMVTNLIDGGNIKIYGDGKNVRDWLHVWDHCRAIDAVVSSGKVRETYLVGGMSKDVSNLEVAKMLLDYMDLEEERIEFVKDRAGHDRRYAVDWSKINKDLGWEPQHSLEEWLKETVDWYRENKDWWKPLKEGAEEMYG